MTTVTTAAIRLAEGLTIPLDQTPQPIALIGRRGSGKTYAAGKLTEEFLDASLQTVVLDPVGTWWGLRLGADGKTPAYSIPVLGGQHGDIPLEPSAGKLVAQLVAEQGGSLVLDVSEFTGADQRRFVAAFAQELLHAKKRHRSALMVVLEEAQEFAPQMARGDTATMLGAVEKLIKLGRNFGIVPVLVSQRPQSVNKDVLNQTELLLTFQLTGPQERKAVDGWVQEKGADRSVVGELPSLPVGEALVWSPQWLGVFGRFRILPKRTFDASATPGAAPVQAANLSDIDLEALQERMASTIERAKADDPKELRKRIVELERQIKANNIGDARAEPEIRIERVEVPSFSAEDEERIARLEATIQGIAGKIGDIAADVALLRSQVREARMGDSGVVGTRRETGGQLDAGRNRQGQSPGLARGRTRPGDERRSVLVERRESYPSPSREVPAVIGTGGSNPPVALPKAERSILTALAQNPEGLTRQPLAILTGYAYSGGFRNSLSSLRSSGYIEGNNNAVMTITDAGLEALGPFEPLPTGGNLLHYWLADPRLGKAETSTLRFLADMYPQAYPGPELAEHVGYGYSGGFRNALSKLRTLGLIEGSNASVRASAIFFEED